LLTGTFAGTIIANSSIMVSCLFLQHYFFLHTISKCPTKVRLLYYVLVASLMGWIAMFFSYPINEKMMFDNRLMPLILLATFAPVFPWYVMTGAAGLIFIGRLFFGLNFGALLFLLVLVSYCVLLPLIDRLFLQQSSFQKRLYVQALSANVIYFSVVFMTQSLPMQWLIIYFCVHLLTCLLLGALGQSLYNDFLQRRTLQTFAETDFLTGLVNRRVLDDFIEQSIQMVDRTNGQLALALLDIDHFKQVNDTYGHEVGDYVLRRVSKVIQQNVRTYDLVGRYGGEEFMIVFPHLSEQAAHEISERIRSKIDEMVIELRDKRKLRVTVSIGVSSYQHAEQESLKERADRCLYRAKHLGRNRVIME